MTLSMWIFAELKHKVHFGTFSVNNTTWSLSFTHINDYFHVLTDQNTCTHTFTLHLWTLLSLDIPKGHSGGQMSFISSLDMFNLMKQIVSLRLQGAAGEEIISSNWNHLNIRHSRLLCVQMLNHQRSAAMDEDEGRWRVCVRGLSGMMIQLTLTFWGNVEEEKRGRLGVENKEKLSMCVAYACVYRVCIVSLTHMLSLRICLQWHRLLVYYHSFCRTPYVLSVCLEIFEHLVQGTTKAHMVS